MTLKTGTSVWRMMSQAKVTTFLPILSLAFVNYHAPLKKKFIGWNQVPFMTRNLRQKFIPEVDLELYFVKTLLKKMKSCIKTKK